MGNISKNKKSVSTEKEVDIDKLEKEIKELERVVEMTEALDNLKKNDDFKKVIEDGFLGSYVEEIMDAGMSTEVNIPADAITSSLKSVRELRLYLDRISMSKGNVDKLLEESKKLLMKSK